MTKFKKEREHKFVYLIEMIHGKWTKYVLSKCFIATVSYFHWLQTNTSAYYGILTLQICNVLYSDPWKQSHKDFWCKFTHSFCKLDHFITVHYFTHYTEK
jgi:hypothetical protein